MEFIFGIGLGLALVGIGYIITRVDEQKQDIEDLEARIQMYVDRHWNLQTQVYELQNSRNKLKEWINQVDNRSLNNKRRIQTLEWADTSIKEDRPHKDIGKGRPVNLKDK